MELEELKKELLDIANKIIEGKEDEKTRDDALRKFRNLLVDQYLLVFINEVDPSTLSTLYISKKLINDVWSNLATDASFDFELVDHKDFSFNFAYFIKYALEGKDEKAILKLYEAVKYYYEILAKLKEEVKHNL